MVTESAVKFGQKVISTSLSLLDRARASDSAAWSRLVAIYGPLIYGWCLRAGLQRSDAADVGQDVFFAVNRSLGTFHRDRPGDTFGGWVYRITRNKIIDFLRRNAVTGTGGEAAHRLLANLPEEGHHLSEFDTERAALARRAMESVRCEFEEKTWQAFWRTFVLDESTGDVAQSLELSANAVLLAKSRVRRRIREEFDSLADFNLAHF